MKPSRHRPDPAPRRTPRSAEEPGPRQPDPLDDALGRVGDRWTLLVVRSLMERPARFNDLMERVGSIAPNILTKRLRQLELDGLVVATAYSRKPVRLAYALTEPGRELAIALDALADWGSRQQGQHRHIRHDACGTPIELRRWCPTCERTVADDALDDDLASQREPTYESDSGQPPKSNRHRGRQNPDPNADVWV